MFKSKSEWVTDIFNAVVAAVQVEYPNYTPLISEKNINNAFSNAHSVELWDSGLQNENIRRQGNPLQADSINDVPYGNLEQWGLIKLGRLPFSTGKGEYSIQIQGSGGVYEAGLKFTNSSTGFSYTLKERVSINEKNVKPVSYGTQHQYGEAGLTYQTNNDIEIKTAVVVADIGGLVAALSPGDELSSTQPLAGIDNPSLVIGVVTEPSDNESLTEYREDTLQAYRVPKRGGARGDYVLWADNVSGVVRVYPYASDSDDQLGSMRVFIESTDETGAASPELVDIVRRVYDLEVPTSDCAVIIQSVVVQFLPIIIDGLTGVSNNDLTAAQSDILTNCKAYFKSIRPFIDGVDRSTAQNDVLQKVELIDIVLDSIAPYNGVIENAYWNVLERTREADEGQLFRVLSVSYI